MPSSKEWRKWLLFKFDAIINSEKDIMFLAAKRDYGSGKGNKALESTKPCIRSSYVK